MSVVPARATLPPAILAGLTALTAGLPAVPDGTVILTELTDDEVAVTKLYVYVTAVAPVVDFDTVHRGRVSVAAAAGGARATLAVHAATASAARRPSRRG